MNRFRFSLAIAAIATGFAAWAQASRDYVYMVGSSTIYPFATVVAERFGRSSDFRTPKVESTGSGGGFKLFCDGVGIAFPDITNASRRIKSSEIAACRANGVADIVEIRVGYDGIVLANASQAATLDITLSELFLALAKDIPGDAPGVLVANPHRRWSDIDARLPSQPIEVYGPPPTSGTRDELVEQAMERGCHAFEWLARLHEEDPELHRSICFAVREDGAYIEAGENDNLVVQRLLANQNAFGIFGFSFLDQNLDKLKGATIDGVAPTYDSIAAREYPVTRPLFFYVKKAHVGVIPGLRAFLDELTSERAWGDEGYLADRGLVTLSPDERRRIAKTVESLTPMALARVGP